MSSADPIRILIADDHPVVREGLRQLLNRQPDFEIVGEADTGRKAVSQAQALRPDVVLLDVRIPKLSGIRACQQIVDSVAETRVIMLTSFASDELLFAAMQAGASGYVLKRMDHDELFDTIRQVYQGEELLDPAQVGDLMEDVQAARAGRRPPAFADLTSREVEVLALIVEGMRNREIAAALSLGEGTVRNYVSNILGKLDVPNRAAAAAYAAEHQISDVIPPPPGDRST